MSTFAFKAVDAHGAPARGEVEAENENSVMDQLRARGLIVLKVDEQKPTDVGDVFGRFQRVKPRDLTVATRQLATMVTSGMPLLKSLNVLEDQVESDQLKSAFADIRKEVEAGGSFSEALTKHPKIFNQLYVSMVGAGETGGILDETLRRTADQLEKADSLKRQIRAAMVYPILIGGFALVTLIAMVAFLVPVFTDVIKDISPEDPDLPFMTQISMTSSEILTGRWYVVIGMTVVLIVGFRRWKQSRPGKPQWDRFKLRFPFRIGNLVHKVALARFSRTFSSLTSGGVPVLETIEITGKTSGNAVIEEAMEDVKASVKRGSTIAKPMRQAPKAFPPMVAQMIEVGEDSGALDQMLEKIADFYEDEVDASVKSLSSLLEPLMMIFIGAMVGFIVISMYLPLFSIYDKLE